MKNKRVIVILLAIAILCSLFSIVCHRNLSTPERTIKSLEDAVNHLDKDSVLQCFDQTISGQIDSVLADFGEIGGFSLGNVVKYYKSIVPLLPLLSRGRLSMEELPHVSLDVEDVKQEQHLADVSVKVNLHLKEYDYPISVKIGMCQIGGDWIIQSVHGVELL